MKEMKVGDVIGNYRIVRPLGQGGMGMVYEVGDVRTGKRLALKAFTPHKGNSTLWRKKFFAKKVSGLS